MQAVVNITEQYRLEREAAEARSKQIEDTLDYMFQNKNGRKVKKVGRFTRNQMRNLINGNHPSGAMHGFEI